MAGLPLKPSVWFITAAVKANEWEERPADVLTLNSVAAHQADVQEAAVFRKFPPEENAVGIRMCGKMT